MTVALLCIMFCLIQTESFVCWDCVAERGGHELAAAGDVRLTLQMPEATQHGNSTQTLVWMNARSLSLQTADVLMENFRNILYRLSFIWRIWGKGAVPQRFNAMLQYCVSMRPGSTLSRCRLLQRPHPWHAHPSGAQPIGQSCWQTQPRVAPPSKWNHQSLHYRASLCSPWWVISHFSSTFTSRTLETSLVDKISKTVVTVQMLLPVLYFACGPSTTMVNMLQ